VVDLLQQHHDAGRRFEPTELIEEGPCIAVGLTVTDRQWGGETAEVFKVFTFGGPDDRAVLLQDCSGRDDARARLAQSARALPEEEDREQRHDDPEPGEEQ
jgi:hypothetical protein